MIKLFIVRHGEAKHNLGLEKAHTFAGSQVDNSLTPNGQETAKILAGKLKNKQISVIFSSTLKRCKETAEIIGQELGLAKNIIEIPELLEFNVGRFAGHTEEEVRALFPEPAKDFYDGNIEKWSFPEGENFNQVLIRIKNALEQIKATTENKTGLVVASGMINRNIFYYLAKDNVENWQARSYPHDKIVELDIS